MSKYEPLKLYLLSLNKDRWMASFQKIEGILGASLPKSARRYQEWWANQDYGSQALAWRDAGWKTEDINLTDQTLCFVRTGKHFPEKSRRILNGRQSRSSPALPPYPWDKPQTLVTKLKYEWKPLGRANLREGRLLFPRADQKPGIYRFRLRSSDHEALYIGEASDLKRRLGNYRNPGASQTTNIRINKKLKEALASGCEISVSTITAGEIDTGDKVLKADFSSKVVRCLFENAALMVDGGRDIETLNRAN